MSPFCVLYVHLQGLSLQVQDLSRPFAEKMLKTFCNLTLFCLSPTIPFYILVIMLQISLIKRWVTAG